MGAAMGRSSGGWADRIRRHGIHKGNMMATSRREFLTVLVAGVGLAVAGLDESVAAKACDRTGEDVLFALEVGDPIRLTYGAGANGPDDRAMPPTDYIVTRWTDAWGGGEQRRTLTLAEAGRRNVEVSLTIQRRCTTRSERAVTGAV